MNRHDRRSADRAGRQSENVVPPAPAAALADGVKPRFFLRLVSGILLSNFVLNRVHHPQVLKLLREVAKESRRTDAMLKIQARMSMPSR